MMNDKKDWTHKNIRIVDIRRLSKFYIFTIGSQPDDVMGLPLPESEGEIMESPLMVKDRIFEERLKPYFLKDAHRVDRQEILDVSWNMHITKGYYIKISGGEINKYEMDSEKYYVSYLEIAGPLGTFQSVCKNDDLH